MPSTSPPDDLALVLTGGGARAAYQVGFLRCLGRRIPHFRFPVITGVSAGAINAAFLAAHPGNLATAADALTELWSRLEADDVFRVHGYRVGRNLLRWLARLLTGGAVRSEIRGLADTRPLDRLLVGALETAEREIVGVGHNLEAGRLHALALTTLNYATGQTVTWVQGSDIEPWQHPNRRGTRARMTVDHVLASAALPLVFPAVHLRHPRLGDGWYGDGGIRFSSPLSPARHLGARRILAISTRYRRTDEEADRPDVAGYPPPAQILGQMLNAVFLDVLDDDIAQAERLSEALRKLPPEERGGHEPLDILALRPSQDLARLAADYEPQLSGPLRYLTRGLGSRETESPDALSLLLFQPDYLRRLIEIGEQDAEARVEEIMELVGADGG